MHRLAAPLLIFSLACALASAGCRGSGSGPTTATGAGGAGTNDGGETIATLDAFTKELTAKVESAVETKAGLEDAQKLLDARKAELAARVASLRASPEVKADASARGHLLEAEVDDTERVHRLQIKYADASARDPDFKERLDRLVSDYDSIFK